MTFPGMAKTRILAALPLLAMLAGCNITGDCGDTVFEKTVDPESGMIAWGYVRNCGATTGFTTQVAVGKPNTKLKRAEIVMVVADDDGDALIDRGAIWLRMAWTHRQRLSISYDQRAELFKNLPEARGASISYHATSPEIASPPVP